MTRLKFSQKFLGPSHDYRIEEIQRALDWSPMMSREAMYLSRTTIRLIAAIFPVCQYYLPRIKEHELKMDLNVNCNDLFHTLDNSIIACML